MTISVYDSYQWKVPKAIYVFNSNTKSWVETTSVSIQFSGNWKLVHKSTTISSNVTNANLYTIAGSPTSPLNFKVTIAATATISASNANVSSLSISGFPTGSRIYLINRGTIQGATGNAGWPGGNAISTTTPMIINNLGTIAGGLANTVSSKGLGYYLTAATGTPITYEGQGTLLGLVK